MTLYEDAKRRKEELEKKKQEYEKKPLEKPVINEKSDKYVIKRIDKELKAVE